MSATILQIPTSNTETTMSSREIAELTGKAHDKVCGDIERILEEAEIGVAGFSGTYLTKQNKQLTEYNLPKRECDLVVSGYSVKYRLAIIDRWHELEKQPKELSFEEMVVKTLGVAKERIQRLEDKIAVDKPKVTYADAVLGSNNPICIRDWVKTLQTEEGLTWGERKVWKWFEEEKLIFRQKGKPRPYAGKPMDYFTLEPIVIATSKGNKEQFAFKITGLGQIELGDRLLSKLREEHDK